MPNKAVFHIQSTVNVDLGVSDSVVDSSDEENEYDDGMDLQLEVEAAVEEKIVRGNKNITVMEANKSGVKFHSRLEQ